MSRVGHEAEQAWQNLCSSVTCPDRISLQTPHWGGRLRLINVKNHNYNDDDFKCWKKNHHKRYAKEGNYQQNFQAADSLTMGRDSTSQLSSRPPSPGTSIYVRNINASVKNALNLEHSFESCFYRIWTRRSSSERRWTLIFWCWVDQHQLTAPTQLRKKKKARFICPISHILPSFLS